MPKSYRNKIVLTGGGTRGIYQIGALKAFKEAGILGNVVSISGCSIGALNAILSAQYDIEDCYKIWMEISRREVFAGINQYARDYYYKVARETILTDGVDINPFIKIFNEYIDPAIVKNSEKEIVITTYNITKRQQEYYDVRQLSDKALIDYLIASCRLPIFKPVYINGDRYVDGGVGDNQPYYSALENKHFDNVFTIRILYVSYYLPMARTNNITFNNELIIKPSGRLGIPITFKNPGFEKKYEMGYKDAIGALKKAGY